MKTMLATILAAAILAVGCGRKPEPAAGGRAESAMPVKLVPAQARVWAETDAVAGTVRAKNTAVVSAQAGGVIVEMRAEAGMPVKAGDVLAVLDVKEARARLAQAVALKAQAEAARVQAQAELERARADRARYAKLLEQEAATRQEFEAVLARAKAAESATKQAEAGIAAAAAGIAEASAVAAHASVAAPFDGVVTAKLAQLGDLAQPGRAVAEVADPSELRLEAQAPEAVAARLKAGDACDVALEAVAGPVRAAVSEISPAADAASRTVLVKLALPPGCGARMGQFGRLLVPAAAGAESVVVPEGAVVVRGQLEMVFVVAGEEIGKTKLGIGGKSKIENRKSAIVVMRLVKVGGRRGGEAQILSGLRAGETVVAEGADKLVDGQAVGQTE